MCQRTPIRHNKRAAHLEKTPRTRAQTDSTISLRSLSNATKQNSHKSVTTGAIHHITSAACASLPRMTLTSLICEWTADHEPHGTTVGENTPNRTAMTTRLHAVLAKQRLRRRRPEDIGVRVDRCSSRSVEGRRVAWCTAMPSEAKVVRVVQQEKTMQILTRQSEGCHAFYSRRQPHENKRWRRWMYGRDAANIGR